MEALLELLRQRRIWITIIALAGMTAGQLDVDPDTTADLIVTFIDQTGEAVSAALALWSYLKPKKK